MPGKQRSSINAIRHGLNRKILTPDELTILDDLRQIVLAEAPDFDLSTDLAKTILDYEQTESHLLTVAEREHQGQDGFVDEVAVERYRQETMAHVLLQSQMERKLLDSKLSKQKREEFKLYRDSLKFLARVAGHNEKKLLNDATQEARQTRRLFKRASNQLIKKIKALVP